MPGAVTQTAGQVPLTDAQQRAARAATIATSNQNSGTGKSNLGKAPVGTTGGTTTVVAPGPTTVGSGGGARTYAPATDTRVVAPVSNSGETRSDGTVVAPTSTAGGGAYVPPPQQAPAPAPYVTPANYSVQGGFNMYDPSAAEYTFGQNAGQLSSPGATETYNPGATYAQSFGQTAQGQLAAATVPGLMQQSQVERYATTAQPAANVGMSVATQGPGNMAGDDAYYSSIGNVSGQTGSRGFANNNTNFGVANAGTASNVAANETAGLVSGPGQTAAIAGNPVANYGTAMQGTRSSDVLGQTAGSLYDTSFSKQIAQNPTYLRDAGSNTGSAQTLAAARGMVAGSLPTQSAAAAQLGAGSGQLNTQSAAERFNGAQTIDKEMGATASGQYWDSLQDDEVVPQDMSAYYDRAREKGVAQLDRAAASRGMFNSSAALDQQRELASDIGAQQAQAEADYAVKASLARNDIMGGASAQADTAGLGRYNTLLGGAQAADEGLTSRLELAGEQAADVDDVSLGRAGMDVSRFNAITGAANQADQAAIDSARFGLDTAGQADDTNTGRFVAQNDAARGVDAAGLGVANLGLNAALGADANSLGRYTAQNNVANAVDQAGLASYMGQAGVQNDADTADTSRFSAVNNAAQGMDANSIASFIGQGNLVNEADRNNLASYIGQANVQSLASQTALDRVRTAQNGAQGADAASLGLSNLGLNAATSADQAEIDRLGLLGQGAASADASRINRSTAFGNQLNATTAAALGITGAAYADMFGTDQGYIDAATQMGFGAGGQALSGAQANQAAVGANGAVLTQAGANQDATVRQIATSR